MGKGNGLSQRIDPSGLPFIRLDHLVQFPLVFALAGFSDTANRPVGDLVDGASSEGQKTALEGDAGCDRLCLFHPNVSAWVCLLDSIEPEVT